MNLTLAEKIANAVLYEGYILYPYRPSAVKNRQRWTFGGIYPPAYAAAQGGTDASSIQTQCLVRGGSDAKLNVRVRFLHLQERIVGELEQPLPAAETPLPSLRSGQALAKEGQGEVDLKIRPVQALRIGEKVFGSWQESVEREISATDLSLNELMAEPQQRDFAFGSGRELEHVCDASNQVIGVIIRQQQAIAGTIEMAAAQLEDQLFKITVRIVNHTPFEDTQRNGRDAALLCSFVSTHSILSVRDGEFVSLLDPPEEYGEAAAGCRNIGTYPVLVGEQGERDLMLSSPIILYDYPQIAPESAGDLFDGTEIDEILTLRILTLTDEEKQEARQVDERARELLDRIEALSREQLLKLHGVMHGRERQKEK
ncbi:MAG: hypothetical protein M3347_05895 [Armatimonadota bacterium]|nr:hypothetical protein [Armatimonadota bacterium]